MTKEKQFEEITATMCETFRKKNHDYGNSFEDSLDEFGLIASIVRMGDKFNRIKSLATKEGMVTDESKMDTLLDLANYAIMTAMWLQKSKKVSNFVAEK